jgi:hypothetical protein
VPSSAAIDRRSGPRIAQLRKDDTVMAKQSRSTGRRAQTPTTNVATPAVEIAGPEGPPGSETNPVTLVSAEWGEWEERVVDNHRAGLRPPSRKAYQAVLGGLRRLARRDPAAWHNPGQIARSLLAPEAVPALMTLVDEGLAEQAVHTAGWSWLVYRLAAPGAVGNTADPRGAYSLSLRTASAVHQLLVANPRGDQPVTTEDLCLSDTGRAGVRSTAAALTAARRRGLVEFDGRHWEPTNAAMNRRGEYERRARRGD